MLNSKGERELAYIVSIDSIMPIEGADRVELARVGGWTIMVRKEQFKPGDPAIYFEIDSKLPEKEPFMFLQPKKFAVKTQKYFRGTVLSQGLLMSADDLDWTIVGDAVVDNDGNLHRTEDESRFVTQILDVTYYEPGDNVRKFGTPDKYKLMVQRRPNIFSKPWARWMMRREWGRRVMYKLFGRKVVKKSSWPAEISKTDQERCLIGNTKISTNKGKLRIADIVNKKLDVLVQSYDSDSNSIIYKKITGYHKINVPNLGLIKIRYLAKKGVSTRSNSIVCTPDHLLMTNKGYVRADNISQEDMLVTHNNCYGGSEVIGAIYGMLLGDSNVSVDRRSKGRNVRIATTHCDKQRDYLFYKKEMFDDDSTVVKYTGGFADKNKLNKWTLKIDSFIAECIVNDWYADFDKNNYAEDRIITDNVLKKLTPLSLALWYMDDGSLSHRDGIAQSPSIRINSQGWSLGENEKLVEKLKKDFGIDCRIRKDCKKDGREYYLIYVTVQGTRTLLELVTPYMCKSMSYKTIPEFEHMLETKKVKFKKSESLVCVPIVEIATYTKKGDHVYDIDVEDTHNFFANDIMSHNCQNQPWRFTDPNKGNQGWIVTEKIDGTSTTAFWKRTSRRRHEYKICSRNVVFDKPDKKCFYDTNVYVEMSEKYHFEEVLGEIADEYKLDWVALQGETYGGKIQKRDYSTNEHHFMGFDLIFSDKGKISPIKAEEIMRKYGIPWVPILDADYKLPETVEEMLQYAEGDSVLDGKPREGVVLRSQDGINSFKAVSNSFLLKYHGG